MPKLSHLIEFMSDIVGVEAPTVAVHARHLREAGLISSGGRGPGGAEMTIHDCAALLLSIMGSPLAKLGPLFVNAYKIRGMSFFRFDENRIRTDTDDKWFFNGVSLFDQVTILIAMNISGDMSEFVAQGGGAIKLEVHRGLPYAEVNVWSHCANGEWKATILGEFFFVGDDPAYLELEKVLPQPRKTGIAGPRMMIRASVSDNVFEDIGNFLMGV